MAECGNCKGNRVQGAGCLDCGYQTAEKQQTSETATRQRPARKTTKEAR